MNRIVRLSLILLSFYWPVFAVRAEIIGELPVASYFEDKQRGWFLYEVLTEPIKHSKNEPKI
jgi:conjugal transfer pilus assembly protein TraF